MYYIKKNKRIYCKYKQILGKAGTIAIIDAGLWHKAGKVSTSNRWGLYSYYGPWFVKPYYRFPDMLGNQFPKRLRRRFNGSIKENVLRLLHYHSTFVSMFILKRSNVIPVRYEEFVF